MEKEVIDNQMKVERHQRKHIKYAKKAQHDEAADEIYKDIDEVNKLDTKLAHEGVKSVDKFEKKKLEAILKANEEAEKINYKKARSGDIW